MITQPNNEQQRVIDDIYNNIILFASAGTGKTFTVANRIMHILETGKAKPEEILCLTFTNKACREMTDDIAEYVGPDARKVNIKTIHGFCLSLDKIEAKLHGDAYLDVEVCDEVDELDLLARFLNEYAGLWILEKQLKSIGLIDNISELYTHDVAFSFNRPYWIFDVNGQRVFVKDAKSIYKEALFQETPRNKIKCPNCDAIATIAANECTACGYDCRRYIPRFSWDTLIDYPVKLRDVVSKIKYSRHEFDFYSSDEEQDYQKTVDKLNSSGNLSNILTFYSKRYKRDYLDQDLLAFFKSFGGRFVHTYCAYLRSCNLMDFDDLIICADQLLKNQETRSKWEKRYKFIFIDEMQDTSNVEYRMLEKLFGNNNIMICGDFFQTIYEWRGSDPLKVLPKYTANYHAKTYMFRENYRSTQTLANASFGYLKNIYPHYVGKLCPKDLIIHSSDHGSPILVKPFDSHKEEAKYIYGVLQKLKAEDPSTLCVMARSNSYISTLADYFDQFNEVLPDKDKLRIFTVERNQAFYRTPAIKDLLAFYRILTNPMDSISMERIALAYIKGVGAKTLENIHSCNSLGITASSFLIEDTYTHDDCYYTLLNALESDNIVVYDTETTGLDLTKDQVIQLTAIRYSRTGEPLASFNQIFIPTVPVSQGARDTIPFDVDKEISENGVPAKTAFLGFLDFVKGSVLVGHNSSCYDAPLIYRQLSDLGLPQPELLGQFDTLTIAKQFYSKLPNYKLSTLCEEFRIVNEDAHNALGDVKATAEVLFTMLRNQVIPTCEERKVKLKKFSKRFSDFYVYYKKLQEMLEIDQVPALTADIINTFDIKHKYSVNSYNALCLFQSLIKDAEIGEGRGFLQHFIQNATFCGSQMDGLIKKLRLIPLITVHQSKGCEFNTVILAGADSKTFPSYIAKINNTIEEESRVFYVAISRARRNLTITYYHNETAYYPVYPSEFIEYIPQEYLSYE